MSIKNDLDLDKLKMALKFIARECGEDECEYIVQLKDEQHIEITSNIAPAWRANSMAIFITEPFNQERYNEIKKGSIFTSEVYNKRVVSRICNGEKIQYPINIELYRVEQEISKELNDAHDINIYEMDDILEEKMYKLKEYDDAKLQVARELIALDLL